MVTNIKRLVVFEKFADPIAERTLAARPDIDLVRLRYAGNEAENWSDFKRTHGYQIGSRVELREPWFGDARLIANSPNLLAICSMGAGYDVIDVDACTKAGIIVCNQSGTNKEAVAEHALGFMLVLSKKIAQADRAMRRQSNLDRFLFTGNDLLGKTVGIIGLGNIGTRVCDLCRGLFRMTVLAYDPYLTAAEMAARGGEKVELDDLLRASDYVSINCPLTKESRGMIGARQFALMQPHAYFINTARGFIHDEDALLEALRSKAIAGAGLDVWTKEPPQPEHPLLQFDNVLASPHTAGVTKEARINMGRIAAEQMLGMLDGKRPPRLINPEVWPAYAKRFEQTFGFAPA